MNLTTEKFLSTLRDPYKKKDDRLFFLDENSIKNYDESAESGINAVKKYLKKFPFLFELLHRGISPGFSCNPHLTAKKSIAKAFGVETADKIIVSVGSGIKIIHPDVLLLDVYPFENAQLVADARKLPFRDASVDMIICESVLEHVPDPYEAIAEINRVVKPGGYIYIGLPFMYPFHASPNDYFRLTIPGLKSAFKDFETLESGMKAGPMAALQGVLMHLCALIFSFGIEPLYLLESQLFMVLFAPLKLLDFFFGFLPNSHEIAADIYIFGKKKK